MKPLIIIKIILIPFLISIAQQNFNKSTNYSWKQIDSLKEARVGHAIVVLPNGNILVSGGEGGYQNSKKSSAEIYDLNTGKWRYTNSMIVPRVSHNLILLKTGKVLAIGGYRERSCELFDPMTDTWSMMDSIPTLRFAGQTVTELKDGRILVAGGFRYSEDFTYSKSLNNCEIYNPDTGKWEITAPLNTGRSNHTAVLLNDARVLIAGGSIKSALRSCEIYDPINNKWSITTSMNEPRSRAASILLPNGNVFVSGGDSIGVGIIPFKKSSEVFGIQNERWLYVADMFDFRVGHQIYLISSMNQLLILGGAQFQSTYEDTWETYDPINLKPIQKGIFPVKKIYEKNSVKLDDERIVLIGGQDFDIISGLPAAWPSKSCYTFDLVTSIEESSPILEDYRIFQNYPNPFNPKTKIGFYLPRSTNVRIEVYDILGRLVSTLINDFKSQGYYEVEFDAKELTSSVYFYKIISGNYAAVKKMSVIK